MVRTSVLKALICAGLVSMMPLAHGAGLGKLTVNSALGQPLKAEIELVAVEKDELSAISARVASPQAYKEANLDRPGALSNVRFDVTQKSNGQPVLRINSTRTFNEPFVNLLIELTYPSGRLLREYTVLLDPQGTAQAQTFDPVGAPIVKSRTPARVNAAPRAETSPGTASAYAETPAGANSSSGDASTYAVKKGDNLARIAARVKPQEVSLEQAMTGIYANNKSAFVGGNMNRLRSGQILNVPQASELAAVEPTAAAREIKAHATDWNAYRQKLAASVESKSVAASTAQQTSSGKITTATPDAPTAAAAPKDVLRLSKGETGTATGAGGKEAAQLREKVAMLQEDAIARERTIKEANERISALEKNIQEMRKLLELRSQNLAELQKQAARTNATPAPVAAPPAPAVTPTPAPAPAETAPAQVAPAPAPIPAPAATAPAAPPTEPLVKALPDSGTTPSTAPQQPAKPRSTPAATTPATESGPSLLDHVRDNALMLAAIAAGVLILLLATLKVLGNRRRRSLATFEDSIMTGGDLKANTVFGNTQGGSIDTGDTSFLTDFSQAGMGTIDTNDVDPIAEAEVYMAYGRDAQAEEILKEAMSKDPNRHEIKLKLLEIYASRKNLIAFETLASELYGATGGKSTPAWIKAAEMGRAIDPDNPLYGSTKGLPSDEPDTISGFKGSAQGEAVNLNDIEPQAADLGPSGENDATWDLTADSDQPSNVVNFEQKREADDFAKFDLDQPEKTQNEPSTPEPESFTSELDADSIISQAYSRPSEPADSFDDLETTPLDQQTISPNSGNDDLSLDFSIPEQSSAAETPSNRDMREEALADGLDFDFNIDEEPARPAEPAAPAPLDLSGIDLDMDKNSFEPAATDDLSFDDMPAGEEVATKLDLAKAYMEMGDKEGAREILEEVMQEGDSQQKDDAKKLLAAVS